MTRREAVKLLLKSIALASVPCIPHLAFSSTVSKFCSGKLNVFNAHTNESLKLRYLDMRGNFDSDALDALDHLFRCHHNDKVHRIDRGLYVLLDAVRTKLGATGRRYRIYSGYRSPEYNMLLRKKSRAVAKNSYHLKGMAADIALEGVRLNDLHRMGLKFKKGGVGKYSRFIHLDVGPFRAW
jgi:uncharacterized protein YcbK (DUF882 family)